MIENCPYCTPTTGGHDSNCPNNPRFQMGPLTPIPEVPMGWICPKCGTVYGPHVNECWRCPTVVVVGTGNDPTDSGAIDPPPMETT